VPRQADPSQLVVGSQRLRKLRSASVADLIGAEMKLRRAERSRHANAHLAMPTHSRRLAPRHADPCQRAVDCQCLRKLRSASIADVVVIERELRQAERNNGHRIRRQCVPRFAQSCCSLPCQADPCQRVIGRKSLRKLRSASVADMAAKERELRRVERSRHSVGQWASHPTSMCASPRPITHAPCPSKQTPVSVWLDASAFANSAAPASPIWLSWRESCAEPRSRHSMGQWAPHPTSACVPRPSQSRMHHATPCGPQSAFG